MKICIMNAKRISFREISEFLSKKEMKNVVGGDSGGSGGICYSSTCSGECGSYQSYKDGKWVTVTMYCSKGPFNYCGCL